MLLFLGHTWGLRSLHMSQVCKSVFISLGTVLEHALAQPLSCGDEHWVCSVGSLFKIFTFHACDSLLSHFSVHWNRYKEPCYAVINMALSNVKHSRLLYRTALVKMNAWLLLLRILHASFHDLSYSLLLTVALLKRQGETYRVTFFSSSSSDAVYSLYKNVISDSTMKILS